MGARDRPLGGPRPRAAGRRDPVGQAGADPAPADSGATEPGPQLRPKLRRRLSVGRPAARVRDRAAPRRRIRERTDHAGRPAGQAQARPQAQRAARQSTDDGAPEPPLSSPTAGRGSSISRAWPGTSASSASTSSSRSATTPRPGATATSAPGSTTSAVWSAPSARTSTWSRCRSPTRSTSTSRRTPPTAPTRKRLRRSPAAYRPPSARRSGGGSTAHHRVQLRVAVRRRRRGLLARGRRHGGERLRRATDWSASTPTRDVVAGDDEPRRCPARGRRPGARVLHADGRLGRRTPIDLEELGYPTGPGRTEAAQRRRWRLRRNPAPLPRHLRDHGSVNWFGLRDNNSAGPNFQSYFGLLRDDYSRSPPSTPTGG